MRVTDLAKTVADLQKSLEEVKNSDTKKTVEDLSKRMEEVEKSDSKKAVEDLNKRMDELEAWPGTSDDAIIKVRLFKKRYFQSLFLD